MASAQSTSALPRALRDRIEGLDWYHCLELAPGLVTPGMFDLRPYVGRYGLPDRLDGLRVLDVGTFDGFWAFELERRGAEVTALDVERVQQLDWPIRLRPEEDEVRGETFAAAAEALGSRARRVPLSIYDATPAALGGTFDLVFCGSILIHLRDPVRALERMAALCGGRLVLAEEYSRRYERIPGPPIAEFRGETPWMTWWRPTTRAWIQMVRTAGFEDVTHHGRFAMRFASSRGSVPHTVLHARGGAA